MKSQKQVRLIAYLLASFIVISLIIDKVIMKSPVFDMTAREDQETFWEQYESDFKRRNLKKMNMSYTELMTLAEISMNEGDFQQAIQYLFDAKCLFPDRILPRKNLCYSYLMRCQDDLRYCRLAKREIYFAHKYVPDSDQRSRQYIDELAILTRVDTLLELTESEALTAIF